MIEWVNKQKNLVNYVNIKLVNLDFDEAFQIFEKKKVKLGIF